MLGEIPFLCTSFQLKVASYAFYIFSPPFVLFKKIFVYFCFSPICLFLTERNCKGWYFLLILNFINLSFFFIFLFISALHFMSYLHSFLFQCWFYACFSKSFVSVSYFFVSISYSSMSNSHDICLSLCPSLLFRVRQVNNVLSLGCCK